LLSSFLLYLSVFFFGFWLNILVLLPSEIAPRKCAATATTTGNEKAVHCTFFSGLYKYQLYFAVCTLLLLRCNLYSTTHYDALKG
jgi:hypothetical protein